MTTLKLRTKCVASPIEPKKDGLRVLITRYRGRGLPADRYDVWMPNLGPSEKLLKRYLADKLSWNDFMRQYRGELFEEQPLDRDNPSIKNHGQKFSLRLLKCLAGRQPVTLMCHCAEDEPHCHRHVLQKLISSNAL